MDTVEVKQVVSVCEVKLGSPPSDGKKGGSASDGKKGKPILRIFLFFCILVAVVLHFLKDYGYALQVILCIGLTGVVSAIIISILAKLLEGGNSGMSRIFWRRISLVGGGLLIGIVVGILVIGDYYKKLFDPTHNNDNLSIEQINQRVSRLKLEPSSLKFCSPDRSRSHRPDEQLESNLFSSEVSQQPKSQYVVSIKDNSSMPFYLFDVTEYTLDTGRGRPATSTLQICKYIDGMYDEKDPILEAIRKLPIDLSIRGCLNLPVPELTVELLYIIRKISKFPHSRVEILVRGFADGQAYEWSKPLRPGNYAYRDITLYPKANCGYFSPFEYDHTTRRIPVPQFYSNSDLPNLRAKFIKEELIEPFLSQCGMPHSVGVYVLEGHEFSGIDRAQRKAQIYILLY